MSAATPAGFPSAEAPQGGGGVLNFTENNRKDLRIAFLGFPSVSLDGLSESANAEFDPQGNLLNSGEVAAAFSQLALQAGVSPQLAATTFVAGRSVNERFVEVSEEPGTVWIGDIDDPGGIVVLTGQLNITITNTETYSLVVGLLSPIHFAQFGDGGGLFSQVLLFGLVDNGSNATLRLRGNEGAPLATDLNGQAVQGEVAVAIPARGLERLRSDGAGDAAAGSATVTPAVPLGGVILFGGSFGLAGVGTSAPLPSFVAPMETGEDLNTGVAIANVSESPVTIALQLCDLNGTELATANVDLAGLGHLARFVDQFDWSAGVDFSAFRGLLKARSPESMAATVIQTRTGEFATMPVAPLFAGNQSGPAPADAAPASSWEAASSGPQGEAEGETYTLLFGQFGDGLGQIFSQILLINPDPGNAATGELFLTDDDGMPLSVDLNGVEVAGRLDFEVPAGGLTLLETDGMGDLAVGAARVASDRPLAGVILFGGPSGVAGVGESPGLRLGFLAPVESNAAAGINTGIAVFNVNPVDATLRFKLRDAIGREVATAELALPPRGHRALFVDQIPWPSPPDLSEFEGVLEVDSGGAEVAATVIQTRPGQFATMPVAPSLRESN